MPFSDTCSAVPFSSFTLYYVITVLSFDTARLVPVVSLAAGGKHSKASGRIEAIEANGLLFLREPLTDWNMARPLVRLVFWQRFPIRMRGE